MRIDFKFFRKFFERNVKPHEIWADLGCGTADLAKRLSILGAQVTAIDGSDKMLEQAIIAIGDDFANKISFVRGDVLENDKFEDETFDGLVCSSVIEYVDDPKKLLSEIARLARPGAMLIISLPPTFSPIRMGQKILRVILKWFGGDVFTYLEISKFEASAQTASNMLKESGFEILNMTKFDPFLPIIFLKFFRPSLLIIEARKR